MRFNKLTGIAEQPAKADKSAVCTINRHLRVSGFILLISIIVHPDLSSRGTIYGIQRGDGAEFKQIHMAHDVSGETG